MSDFDYLNREQLMEGLVADAAELFELALAGEVDHEAFRNFLNGPLVKQARQDVYRRELGSIFQVDDWELHAQNALGHNVGLRERKLARRVLALIAELRNCKLASGNTWAEENELRGKAKLKEPL